MPRRPRIRPLVFACLLAVACAALLPALASAAEPPTLTSPAASADPATEGGTVTFTWKGDLQGDPTALDRSFFRVELIPTKDMPSGAQTAWPESDLENFYPTEPGQSVTTASMGVPAAGSYRWRVCAWGVVSVMTDNVIQQLPGGCSAARAFTSVAAKGSSQSIGELTLEQKQQVEGQTTTVFVNRNTGTNTTTTTAPQPADPQPQVEEPVQDTAPTTPLPPARFQQLVGATTPDAADGTRSVVGLSDYELASDAKDGSKGVTGAVLGGLGSTLPFVPIPFWTLLLLLALVPLLVLWRRDVLGMFEWSDGSIDGAGTMPAPEQELALVPLASGFKDGSKTADGEALAPPPAKTTHASEGRRRAA